MCVGDYRVDRLVKHVATSGNITTTSDLVIPANRQRVGLVIGNSGSTYNVQVYLAPGLAQFFAQLSVNGTPLTLTLRTHGDFCTRAFYIRNTVVGPSVFSYIEMFLPEHVLRSLPEEIERVR